MTKHAAAHIWAVQQIGKREDPMGSNTGGFVRFCQQATWLGGTNWPWCVAFVMRAYVQAGFKLPWRGAGAYAFLDWARKAGWAKALSECEPGDAVVFNIGAGHVGMLDEPYTQTDPYVVTVDGNVSDSVQRRRRHISEVRGSIHVPEAHKVAAVKPPVYEVVTSASGHVVVVYVSGAKAISKRLDRMLRRHGKLTIRRRRGKR